MHIFFTLFYSYHAFIVYITISHDLMAFEEMISCNILSYLILDITSLCHILQLFDYQPATVRKRRGDWFSHQREPIGNSSRMHLRETYGIYGIKYQLLNRVVTSEVMTIEGKAGLTATWVASCEATAKDWP